MSEPNALVPQSWVEAINRNDVGSEMDCFDPDAEYRVVPTGTKYQGTDELA